MGIEQEIENWDGKTVREITAIYDRYNARIGFIDSLVDSLRHAGQQRGSSWLIKNWIEDGHRLGQTATERICALVNEMEHWEAKLHLLQVLPSLAIPRDQAGNVYRFVRSGILDPNKLVRAWAYGGFYHLARQHDSYAAEARELLEVAMRDEAASVRARLRNVMKGGAL